MTTLSRWILVVVITLAGGCFGAKNGPRGTNVGPPSDVGGPWSKGESGGGGGGSPAATAPR
ncbi:MAG TPA: hypothetical protein VFS15_28930 [Kofleriaceae bacterium]|nr:hypothetical protein [Kofleriaceae bacterium]